MNQPYRPLFQDVDWGTEKVLNQTYAKAQYLDLDVYPLEEKQDIDTATDLAAFLKTSPLDYPAAVTREVVRLNPLPITAL